MKFYDDVVAERTRIEEIIRRYGYAPEHNFHWYRFSCEEGDRNIFVETENGALLTVEDPRKHEYTVFSSPVAPPERRAPLLIEYAEYIFSNTDAHKVWLELEAPLRRDFLRLLPDHLKARPINYTLTWPVTDLRTFDPELPGGHYKALRKEKHKFYREHTVAICDAKTYTGKEALHAIIRDWRKKRNAHDRAWTAEYHNVINGNFEGMTEAHVFMVDGRAAGINGGWPIPNSDRYYGAVGIHNYSVEDLGSMLYLEDLVWLKQRGYREVDMAGGEKALTAFKNKFCPTSWYKTFVFSVAKK